MDKIDLIVEMLKEVKDGVKQNSEHLSDMKIDVELNRKDLEVHISRTENNEKLIEKLEIYIKESLENFNERLNHLQNRLTIKYLLKLIVTVSAGLSTVLGLIYTIIKIFS